MARAILKSSNLCLSIKIVTIVYIFSSLLSLEAASLREVSVEDLARASRSCHRVEVQTVQAESRLGFAFSKFNSRVLETLKGASPQGRRLEFYVPGSREGARVRVSGAPSFEVGSEYLICLVPDTRDPAISLVSFWTSYQVKRDERTGQRNLVLDGEISKSSSSREVRSSHYQRRVQTYDEVVTRIMDSN